MPRRPRISGGRGERLAFLDDIGDRKNRWLVAVLAAVGPLRWDLEPLASLEGPGAQAVDVQLQPALDDIARFDPRMGVARDHRAGIEIDADVHRLVAVHRPVRACYDGALQPARRVLRRGAGRQEAGERA